LSAKFEQLKTSLLKDHIIFNYKLERGLHDRFIEADTGWRVVLGRGLDIYQKPEARFSLGFIDQTKRRCKPTTITFAKSAHG
jgi:ATP-dependent Lon protease